MDFAPDRGYIPGVSDLQSPVLEFDKIGARHPDDRVVCGGADDKCLTPGFLQVDRLDKIPIELFVEMIIDHQGHGKLPDAGVFGKRADKFLIFLSKG